MVIKRGIKIKISSTNIIYGKILHILGGAIITCKYCKKMAEILYKSKQTTNFEQFKMFQQNTKK